MRVGPWLEAKAPRVHGFFTRSHSPYPLPRVALAVAVVALLVLGGLALATPVQSHPVTVDRYGDMMHCRNGFQSYGNDCKGTIGRLGALDPGDVVLVQRVDGPDEVGTLADGSALRYGKPGDVLVFSSDGDPWRVLLRHRALFFLVVNEDGTYSVPSLGINRVSTLDQDRLVALTGCPLASAPGQWTPEDSGFVTRGDNNPTADQCTFSMAKPIRADWIVGRARGELPWAGLVVLLTGDFLMHGKEFSNAPTDSKVLLLLVVLALIGGFVWRRTQRPTPAAAAPPAAP